MSVAPFAGAWIEILELPRFASGNKSLPSRERGLKYKDNGGYGGGNKVAPFAGAWIEIFLFYRHKRIVMSLPSRERGLKSPVRYSADAG